VTKVTDLQLQEIDRAALYALAAIGDADAAVELGHFGKMTTAEAVVRLKKLREFTAANLSQKASGP
jgi:hypothetical protein